MNAPSALPRVLLLDDEEGIRHALGVILESSGYACVAAGSIAEARTLALEHQPFAAIVCDGILPDGSGAEFIDWLRDHGIDAPVLFISGSVEAAPARPDLLFLPKPFAMNRFKRALEEAVARART